MATISKPAIAWSGLLALGAGRIALFLFSTLAFPYGYMPDEFYFLDCADHLAWGYVDHPPLSIASLSITRALFGTSLLGIRFVPALANATAMILTGLIARELGGGRWAQCLAALMYLIGPTALAMSGYYSMNALDQVVWASAVYVLVRLIDAERPSLWLALGLLIGLGWLNKMSIMWLVAALAVAVVLTPQRRWLLSRWPYLAALLAMAVAGLNVIWQIVNDWPTLEFMTAGMAEVMVSVSPVRFLIGQIVSMHLFTAPFWIAGLFFLLRDAGGSRYRLLAWIWIVVVLILVSSGTARPYYLTPANCIVLAAGGVMAERFTSRWKSGGSVLAIVLAVGGLLLAPMALPLMSPASYIAYEHALKIPRAHTEFAEGELPVHYGLRFGWPELAQQVAEVFHQLPPDEQAATGLMAESFGEIGALNFYGRSFGLPPAIGGHNNYWYWGPGRYSGESMVIVAGDPKPLERWFSTVEKRGEVHCPYCLPFLTDKSIYLCKGAPQPLDQIWVQFRSFR